MTKKTREKEQLVKWGLPLGFVLIIVAVILLLIFFMQGKTITTGSYPENITSESLTCNKQGSKYPFFKYGNSEAEETKISAVFTNNKLDSISLTQTMNYLEPQAAETSRASNMASMNKSFGQEFGPGAFNARYTVKGNSMQMNLYATSSDIKEGALKFFLVEDYPSTLSDYKENYISQGFSCENKD